MNFCLFLGLVDKNEISQKLFLNDCIKFFLDNKIGEDKYFKSCIKTIKLLLKLRFSSDKNLMIKKRNQNRLILY